VVTLLSIVYSDTCDMTRFIVTTKTYVTGITIYNTLTRFIVTTKTYVTGITIYNTQQCNHQNLCHDACDICFGGYNESCQSIVYSDACDIGFGGYNESCQSIVYSDASDMFWWLHC
jgi:hypothetical protein